MVAARAPLESMLAPTTTPIGAPPRSGPAEHAGDEITHDIGQRLEATFVTPLTARTSSRLISGLDDVVDLIEEVADTFVLYRIEAPTRDSDTPGVDRR